ncbi:MAG: flagellar basal body-associated FliL family protein [Gammaproteobacteria bacterium]
MQLSPRVIRHSLLWLFLFSLCQNVHAEYVDLDPPFVVNLYSEREIKFAQVSAQVRVNGKQAVSALATHNPAIRHALVMLFSSKTPEQASSRQGKEELRTEAVETIRQVLEEQQVKFNTVQEDAPQDTAPQSPIQDVFFTRFIIQ